MSHGRDISVGSDAKKIHAFESEALELISESLFLETEMRNESRKTLAVTKKWPGDFSASALISNLSDLERTRVNMKQSFVL